MTNAEAREHLKDILADVPNDKCIDWIMALKQAIKALEQQSSEDCISREEAIRVAEQGQIQGYEWQFKKLCTLSSVTPQQTRWIPVSERLPKDEQKVLVTTRSGKLIGVSTSIFHHASAYWEHYVIAWMPLPEPYNAESEVNADDCSKHS